MKSAVLFRSLSRWVFGAVMLAAAHVAMAATPPPIEAFARLPLVQAASISPNGRWFAAIMNRDSGAVVVARSTDGDEPAKAIFKTDNNEYTLAWVRWVSDDRLVVSVHFADRRGFADTTETRLVAIDRDGSHQITLIEPGAFDAGRSQIQDQVIDWLPADGHHVLLQARSKGGDPAPAVYRVDVDSGHREIVMARRLGVMRWFTDGTHRVRVGVRQVGTKVEVLVCDAAGENWHTAWQYELYDRATVTPLGFGRDPNQLYVYADHDGRLAVYSVDLREPALPRQLVMSHDTRDVRGGLVIDPVSGNAVGVESVSNGDSSAGYWNADMKRFVAAIDVALPERANRLLQISIDGTRYLVYSSGNGLPGQFLVGDRSKGALVVLGRQYPELAGDALVKKTAHTVKGRSGERVPVLLTLPAGVDAKALPTIVMSRGGAIASESASDFDPLVEFLASRGYAVLQVNARRISDDESRSRREQRYSADAQDDLADAAAWLVARGTANPARVCVMGAGAGGYAALMSAERMPELFKCAVSVAGISDLVEYGRYRAHYVNAAEVLERQLGDVGDDRQRQRELSPQNLAAQFKVPVLLVHGTADRVVPYEQSKRMAGALADAGKPVKLVSLADGDNAIGDAALRLQFYRELEGFLASQIGNGQPQAAASVDMPVARS